ncbi:hypothetical protein WME88_45865 [Sorangium sp. So ce216]
MTGISHASTIGTMVLAPGSTVALNAVAPSECAPVVLASVPSLASSPWRAATLSADWYETTTPGAFRLASVSSPWLSAVGAPPSREDQADVVAGGLDHGAVAAVVVLPGQHERVGRSKLDGAPLHAPLYFVGIYRDWMQAPRFGATKEIHPSAFWPSTCRVATKRKVGPGSPPGTSQPSLLSISNGMSIWMAWRPSSGPLTSSTTTLPSQ